MTRKFFEWLKSPSGVAVCTIGIVQIITWGTSFYSLGVLGRPIVEATGWSNGMVFGGLTVGLLVAAVISAPIGTAIDRYGARLIMTFGCILLALTLLAVALVQNEVQYLAAWAAVGVAMRLTLYDAAFAAMVEVSPENGRQGIAFLTLFGGFASTVFWLFGHDLVVQVGWRETFMIFAGLNLVVCTPLCWLGLRRRTKPATVGASPSAVGSAQPPQTAAIPPASVTSRAPLTGHARTVAMALFCLVMASNALVFGVGAVHLVGIIEASGIATAVAVGLASLKGIAQVAGRVWEIVFGKRLSPLNLGRLAIGLLPLSFVVLLAGGADPVVAGLFTLIFGASNGLVTVVRGAVPLALFGSEGYGKVLGIIATPVLFCNAVSPAVFAIIVDKWGYAFGTWILLAIAAAALMSMEIMAAWYRRHLARETRVHEPA